ncbi:hypothetical protein [Mucilaginibacter arboris]|uniref:Uncharacterized protein n=1 Tax=Mucilaginibacter arboris TaxID=2682090 RepID=A0A7K1SZX4_9SPHI|nr:hypothetical protein [Mucilaginibacter arboris]MVN22871.1 hypothetical protein [Mucilaginibacter arboris]
MIETSLTIILNRIEDIENIENILKDLDILSPIYIIQIDDTFQITFTTEYEYYELESKILINYCDYEFTKDLGNGRKEIRIQISRVQFPYSRDSWGRPIEDPINETYYLIKKVTKKIDAAKVNPRIKVLFEKEERSYYINIVCGVIATTDEKGFLVLNDFNEKIKADNKNNFLINELFETRTDAFWQGYNKLNNYVQNEFEEYVKNKRKINKRSKK